MQVLCRRVSLLPAPWPMRPLQPKGSPEPWACRLRTDSRRAPLRRHRPGGRRIRRRTNDKRRRGRRMRRKAEKPEKAKQQAENRASGVAALARELQCVGFGAPARSSRAASAEGLGGGVLIPAAVGDFILGGFGSSGMKRSGMPGAHSAPHQCKSRFDLRRWSPEIGRRSLAFVGVRRSPPFGGRSMQFPSMFPHV